MLRSTICLGLGLALQLWAATASWPLAVQAQQAAPVPANAAPAMANPGSHDSAIIHSATLPTARTKTAISKSRRSAFAKRPKKRAKQEVMLQVQEEEAAKAGPHSPAINGSDSAAATAFDQATPAAGTNTGDAVPASQDNRSLSHPRRPTTTGSCTSFFHRRCRIRE